MKNIIDPSLMEKNPSYTKVQVIQESSQEKGNSSTVKPTQPLQNTTNELKCEPVYVNTTNMGKKYGETCTRNNTQPHYENMELLKSSSQGERQSTNQNTVTTGNKYYQNVSLKANNRHHHYYNTETRTERQNDRETNISHDMDSHDYANLPPTITKQSSLDNKEGNYSDETTGSTATLTMNEVL